MKYFAHVLIILLPLNSALVSAEVKFNGFVSVGAGRTLGEDEVYSVNDLSDASYTDEVSFKPDSIYAIQATTHSGERLSATAQMTGAGDDNFELEFEWAYISYKIMPELTVQAGRLRTPFFLNSLNLEFGYSYNWVRPPAETNRAAGLNRRIEGIDLTWASNVGDVETTASFTYGSSAVNASISLGPSLIEFTQVIGITGKATYEWLTFRGAYLTSKATATPESLGIALPMNAGNNVKTIAAIADFYPLSIEAEAFQRRFPGNVANDDQGWYLSGSYAIGDFIPHITYSGFKNTNSNSDSLTREDFKTLTFGLRYNFYPSAAFKIEYITRSVDTTEGATTAILARGGVPVVEANLIAIAIDLGF